MIDRDKINRIKTNKSSEETLATFLYQTMEDKAKISQLENDLGLALIEIMTIKIGGTQ